jgi:aspartyl/asparaginyl beta-hydroxylase (cupin superfamily)
MFSLLKPRTRIPPHTGVTNVRLVTHVPLIIPADCGFRVGNDTRQWVPGTAWVFDDTIEHEAWNLSDQLRVVLIFDVWHPHLTSPERAMVTALMAGINAFQGEAAGSAET